MKIQIQTTILISGLIMLLIIPFTFTEARNENPGEVGGNTSPGNTHEQSAETSHMDTDSTTAERSEGNPDAGTGGSGSTGGSGQGEGGEPLVGNRQSFPAIAADGFGINLVSETTFEVPYEGPYTGLSVEELAALAGQTWYAQKTEGNLWQADYLVNPVGTEVAVYGVDWGDNIESVNPVIGRPFRLELTIYSNPEEPMDAYTMALLAYPSSIDEVQGTNGQTYESDYATVVSTKPEIVIQSLGDVSTTSLTWNGQAWVSGAITPTITDMVFGSELNVAGKYIFGGSKGGWKPVDAGLYRITFSLPESDISLEKAVVGNYTDWTMDEVETEEEDDEEMSAATPVIDTENNLTYVDLTVITQREGRTPDTTGEDDGEEHETSVVPTTLDTTSTKMTTNSTCEPYLTDYLGINLDNDPAQVVLLQEFLNDTLGTSIPLTGYFGELTFYAVKLFQITHADEILQPWVDAGYTDVSLYEGTGYVYITTLETINAIVCESSQ